MIPDFIPVLGLLDDVILLPALIVLTCKLIPDEIWERNRYKAQRHGWREEAKKMVLCGSDCRHMAADDLPDC